MFKSCFPNSQLSGNPDDPPTSGGNPLRGQDASSPDMTVANAKGIYNDILAYFALHQEKLFVAVTAPPLVRRATDDAHAANARAFNHWLVSDWLAGYPHRNVARVWAKMAPRLCDVTIRPYRRGAVIVQNVFTVMAPAVDSITPGTGSPGELITVAGEYFGTLKGGVRFRYLRYGRLGRKTCKVTSWTMDPTSGESSVTCTVPAGLAAGTYDVVVSSKISSTVVAGGFTVP